MRNCDSVENALLMRNIHLGVSSEKILHPDIECRPFFADRVVLIVPPDHPFTQRPSVQPTELVDQPFILQEENCGTRLIVQEELAKQGISLDQLQVTMVVESAEAITMAVEHRLGLAFISRLAARHGLQTGHLVEVPVKGLLLERPLYITRNSNQAKTTAQSQFWDFVGIHQEEISQILNL
jgi:DNA-binding transcriptional LysR family regulator